jgi:Skp family chaperone for outer membrane proteins
MEPIIKVLEKFKAQQDKIKTENGENAALEAKLSLMTTRVAALEQALATVANLGKDLKYNAKKSKDPTALLEKFAEKLSTIDIAIQQQPQPVMPPPPSASASAKSRASPLRSLRGSKKSA